MFRWFMATVAATITMASAQAAFVVTVTPSVGPDVSSPSFLPYAQNAIIGLSNGGVQAGFLNTPSFYSPSGTGFGGGAINYLNIPPALGGGVTGLWHDGVNPTGAFAGETGNWVYFGLSVVSTVPGETFSANDINWSGFYSFDGALGPVNLGTVGGFGSPTIQGALTAGGPLQNITAATQVEELYYVGIGYSIGNQFGIDYTDAASLEALLFDPATPSGILTGTYTISNGFGSAAGAGGVDINPAPAPATLALFGFGIAGLVARRARRKAA